MDALPFVLLLLMLINASSMFEFHMSVVVVIMFYILKLFMEIVPNYPTSPGKTVGVLINDDVNSDPQ
jgi:hypothetical protein